MPSKCEMTIKFAKLALPSVLANLFSFLIMVINSAFAGQFKTDSARKLAAIGLGQMILGMFCRHIYIGINGAADTLISQAYGQNELRLCGTYLNRGRLINTVIIIPLSVLLSCSEKILLGIG